MNTYFRVGDYVRTVCWTYPPGIIGKVLAVGSAYADVQIRFLEAPFVGREMTMRVNVLIKLKRNEKVLYKLRLG